jgi:hypothetical protein
VEESTNFSSLSVSKSTRAAKAVSVVFLILSSVKSELVFEQEQSVAPKRTMQRIAEITFFIVVAAFRALFKFS